jgi:5-(carboxyamino)imidazole ribonucleotide mutase
MKQHDVLILLGSISDADKMKKCRETLEKFGVPNDFAVRSAHRTPEETRVMVQEAETAGCKVFICAAGMAAHLAGVVASATIKPVIGVPMTPSTPGSFNGLDALLATVQMPPGVPVATVALDAGENAAMLAIQILAINHQELAFKLREHKKEIARKVLEADEKLGFAWGRDAK